MVDTLARKISLNGLQCAMAINIFDVFSMDFSQIFYG